MATSRLVLGYTPSLFHPLLMAVTGGTLVVYNLPRLIPRPYGKPRGPQPLRFWYWLFFFLGLVMATLGARQLPLTIAATCSALAVLSCAYFLPILPGKRKRLRDFGLLKIVLLTTIWTVVTAVLPMLAAQVSVSDWPWEILLRFVFIFALCILFDIQDIETDSGHNIATLPTRIGERSAYTLVYVCLAIFLVLSYIQFLRHPALHGRMWAAVITAIATAVVVQIVRRKPSRELFIAITDGMMLLYALLALLPARAL
jgi:4-hydroxybenzoate polyprenyltransferase